MNWWSEDAPYLHIFGVSHLIYVLFLVAMLALFITKRETVRRNRKKIAAFILTVSILQQITLYGWHFIETGFALSDALPLHISRLCSLLGIWFLLTKNDKVLETLFYFGLFAYGSFSYPMNIYPAFHIMGISFAINHAITILLPFFAFIAYDWLPSFKGFLRTYCLFVIYFFFVYLLNPIVGGNYFYIEERPFFQSWPDVAYVPTVLIGVFVGYFVVYKCVSYAGSRALRKREAAASEK